MKKFLIWIFTILIIVSISVAGTLYFTENFEINKEEPVAKDEIIKTVSPEQVVFNFNEAMLSKKYSVAWDTFSSTLQGTLGPSFEEWVSFMDRTGSHLTDSQEIYQPIKKENPEHVYLFYPDEKWQGEYNFYELIKVNGEWKINDIQGWDVRTDGDPNNVSL